MTCLRFAILLSILYTPSTLMCGKAKQQKKTPQHIPRHCKTFSYKIDTLVKTPYNIQRLATEAHNAVKLQQRNKQARILHKAVQSGYSTFVKTALKAGISPYVRHHKRTPLSTAFLWHRKFSAFALIKAMRHYAKSQNTECPICLDSFSNKRDSDIYVASCCHMVICKQCLANCRQYSPTCPHCRSTLV